MEFVKLKYIDKNSASFQLNSPLLHQYKIADCNDADIVYVLSQEWDKHNLGIMNCNKENILNYITRNNLLYFVVAGFVSEMVIEIHKDLHLLLNTVLTPHSLQINDLNLEEYISIYFYRKDNTLEVEIIPLSI